MKQWLSKHVGDHMIRPVIYMAFTRFIYALTLAFLWKRFVRDRSGVLSLGTHAFFIIGMFFFTMAWFNYLWLDGIRSPIDLKSIFKVDKLQQLVEKRRPQAFSSMVDYVDTEKVSFDQLSEDERTTCKLIANLLCGLLFLLMSLM